LDRTAPGGAGGIGCAAVLIVVGTLFGLEVLSSNTVRSGTVTGRSELDVSRGRGAVSLIVTCGGCGSGANGTNVI
jgi:hypothetical protein